MTPNSGNGAKTHPRNVALCYVRKSFVKKGSPDPASPELQRDRCTERAAALGLAPEVFTDALGHHSGKTDRRPGWQAVVSRLPDPDVAALIVYSHDRAFRNLRALLEMADRCAQLSVRLVLVKDNIDVSTAQGRFMLSLLGSFGEFESNAASERRIEAIDHLRRQKGRHYGIAPFGTVRVPQGGDLVLEPSQRAQASGTDHDALRRLYELRVQECLGYRPLSDRLNADGWRYRGRDGLLREWTSDDVRRVLLCHWLYAGYVVAGKMDRDLKVEVLPGSHSPILPDTLTAAVAADWTRHKRQGPKSRPSYLYPLVGTLYCACGSKLVGGVIRGRRYYRHKRHCWAGLPFQLLADRIETDVRTHIAALRVPAIANAASDKAVLQTLMLESRGSTPAAERERIEQVLERLRKMYEWGDIDEAGYLREREAVRAQAPPEQGGGLDLGELPAMPDISGVADVPDSIFKSMLTALYERIVRGEGEALAYTARAWCAAWA